MALDSAVRRAAALGVGLPAVQVFPIPDSDLDDPEDRAHIVGSYRFDASVGAIVGGAYDYSTGARKAVAAAYDYSSGSRKAVAAVYDYSSGSRKRVF